MMFTKKSRAKAQNEQWFSKAQQDQAQAVHDWNQVKKQEFRVEQDDRWNHVGR
jgi:hypothetical protein